MTERDPLRCVIVEDETPAAEQLRRVLAEVAPRTQVEAVLASVAEAVRWFAAHEAPDLVFCDVELADGLCFEIFESVRVGAPVVFCTAYDAYVMPALERHGIDYVLKPIEAPRIAASLDKLADLERHFQAKLPAVRETLAAGPEPRPRDRFLVRRGVDWVSVPVDDVAFFTTEHKLVLLVDRQGRQHMLDRTLTDLEAELDPKRFLRLNRRFIAHIEAVERFRGVGKGRLAVHLRGAEAPVMVSQENARRVRAWLDG